MPGDFPTFWRVSYSDDRCFVKFPGLANLDMLRVFCPRFGGKVPGFFKKSFYSSLMHKTPYTLLLIITEPRTPEDIEMMNTVTAGK